MFTQQYDIKYSYQIQITRPLDRTLTGTSFLSQSGMMAKKKKKKIA